MVRRILALIAVSLAGLSAFAFYDRYWLWRDCFNDQGRCWDSATEQVYLEQAGDVWGLLTAAFLAAGIMLWRGRAKAPGDQR